MINPPDLPMTKLRMVDILQAQVYGSMCLHPRLPHQKNRKQVMHQIVS